MNNNNDSGAKFYKPSGIFNPKGTVLFFLLNFLLTILIYAVYTLFNLWCKISVLKFASFIIVFLLLGKITKKLVKKFEIREPFIVAFCCILAITGATYFKWGFYDWLDLNKYYYTPLKETMADEYYKLNDFFPEGIQIHKYYKAYHNTKAESEMDLSGLSWEERKAVEGKTIWELQDFDKLLGTSEQEVKVSLERAKTLNGFDFTFKYRKAYEKRNLLTILASPKDIITDIKQINKEGRWSSVPFVDIEDYRIKGNILWILWLTEFLFFAFYPLYKGIKISGEPYIESELRWAKYIDMTDTCKIVPHKCSTGIFKNMIMENPDVLIENLIPGNSSQGKYYSVELWESTDMTENYLTVVKVNTQLYDLSGDTGIATDKDIKRVKTKRRIIKYMYVDKEFVTTLTQKTFELQAIGILAGNKKHEYKKEVNIRF